MIRYLIPPLAAAVFLTACATPRRVDRFVDGPLAGPPAVALAAEDKPWVPEIERRLRRQGVKVVRAPLGREVPKDIGARYTLRLTGKGGTDKATRCFGGGHNFDHITATVIDRETRRTVLTVSDSGYSENCPPASSDMFAGIARAVAGLWRTP
jgi:hypothetical protein